MHNVLKLKDNAQHNRASINISETDNSYRSIITICSIYVAHRMTFGIPSVTRYITVCLFVWWYLRSGHWTMGDNKYRSYTTNKMCDRKSDHSLRCSVSKYHMQSMICNILTGWTYSIKSTNQLRLHQKMILTAFLKKCLVMWKLFDPMMASARWLKIITELLQWRKFFAKLLCFQNWRSNICMHWQFK